MHPIELGNLGRRPRVASTMRISFLTLALLGTLLGTPDVILAQDEQQEPDNRQLQVPTENDGLDRAARLTFEAGREAFANGDYDEALDRFQQAYSLSPRPILLYNIGLALDRLRRDEDALSKFREYLAITLEEAPERTQVEARVRALEQAVERQRALEAALEEANQQETQQTQESAEPVDEGGGLSPVWVIAVGSAALVAGGVTVWSGLDAVSKNDDYEALVMQPGTTLAQAQQAFDDTTSAESRTNILIGVTAGLAVTAGVMVFFTDWSGDGEEEAPSVTPTVALGPGGAMVGGKGTF